MKNKKIIICIIILIIICILLGVYFYTNRSLGTKWGDVYYSYLKANKDSFKNSKISFIEVNDKPIMTSTSISAKNKFTDIYYIKNNKVSKITNNSPSSVAMYYNTLDKKYNWYLEIITENTKYIPISNKINKESKLKEYEITGDDYIVLIDTKIIPKEFDYNKKTLRGDMEESINNYKDSDELITSKVKSSVNKEVKALKKKKEDDKESITDTNTSTTFIVGGFTYNYGRYMLVSNMSDEEVGYMIINNNGTVEINDGGSSTSSTYTIGTFDDTVDSEIHDYKDGILIENGYGFAASNNNIFSNIAFTATYTG